MAQATLEEMAREVRLYSGETAPILLAKRWVRDRYRKVCERQVWSFKLGRGTFGTIDAVSAGSVTLTSGSSTVTGSGTAWDATLVGKQLKTSNGYVFSITAVGSATSLTIDQLWYKATTANLTYVIIQSYITPQALNSDFHAWYSVIDPDNNWLLRLGFNVKELDRVDARRAATGVPRVLANGVYNSSQQATFELWPNPINQKQYLYTYEKRVPDLSDNDTPPPIIRSDALVKGALADLARWPGMPERKNPFFDATFQQWRNREAEFNEELQKLIVEDQSILLTDLSFGHATNLAPLDAKFMQNHAFPAY